MGTRSGDIDVAAVQYLCNKKGWTIDQATNYLNKECGLLGVSGVSSDQRDVIAAANKGNKHAKLALEMLAYSVRKYIGAYMAVLNNVDAVVFTGGIGENGDETREAIISDMDNLGIVLDKKKNKNFKRGQVELISAKNSKVKIYIIPTYPEIMAKQLTAQNTKIIKSIAA